MTSYHALDLTVFGRQERWEDSPDRMAARIARVKVRGASTVGPLPSGRTQASRSQTPGCPSSDLFPASSRNVLRGSVPSANS